MKEFYVKPITAKGETIGYGVYDCVGGLVSMHDEFPISTERTPKQAHDLARHRADELRVLPGGSEPNAVRRDQCPTKLDLLKRDAELARDHVIRKAYETVAYRPDGELKRACDLLDAALHRIYEEEAAIAA